MMLVAVILVVFALNVPFGYWRDATRKYSLPWVLAIHLPVPAVVALRVFSGLGWQLYTFPLVVAAFFVGQYFGARLHARMNSRVDAHASGCLVMDVYNTFWKQ